MSLTINVEFSCCSVLFSSCSSLIINIVLSWFSLCSKLHNGLFTKIFSIVFSIFETSCFFKILDENKIEMKIRVVN